MRNTDPIDKPERQREMWLVGFRLDPDYRGPDVYTVLLEDRGDQPISEEGRVIFFFRPEDLHEAVKLDSRYSELTGRTWPDELHYVYDVAQVFYLVSSADRDDSAYIVNFLNVLFDILKAASISLVPKVKTNLFRFADHLTFNKDFADFLATESISRADLIEGMQWGLGAVLSKSRFYRSPKS